MVFLLPIPITLVLGLIWASWVSRPKRPADPITTVEEWRRAIGYLAPTPRDVALPEQRTEHSKERDRRLARSA